jgi:sigma-B regulation protein RsbU (phosphoserine phosphatase)
MGGDYFDIFELEDKLCFGILVASCSGYSVSAILLSILLKVSSLIEARRGKEPHLVLQLFAQELLPQIKPKDEAHIFYGLVDRRTYQMQYALAGNILAAHQRAGEKWSSFSATTTALGTEGFKPDSSRALDLQSKDRFVICTPGIVESQNLENIHFGRDRWLKALASSSKSSLHETRNEILFQLENFVGSSEFQRDVTVVAGEVQDRILKLTKS